MKDIQTVGQATEYAERAIEAIGMKIEELDVSKRAAFEIKTAPLLKDLSMMVPPAKPVQQGAGGALSTWSRG